MAVRRLSQRLVPAVPVPALHVRGCDSRSFARFSAEASALQVARLHALEQGLQRPAFLRAAAILSRWSGLLNKEPKISESKNGFSLRTSAAAARDSASRALSA